MYSIRHRDSFGWRFTHHHTDSKINFSTNYFWYYNFYSYDRGEPGDRPVTRFSVWLAVTDQPKISTILYWAAQQSRIFITLHYQKSCMLMASDLPFSPNFVTKLVSNARLHRSQNTASTNKSKTVCVRSNPHVRVWNCASARSQTLNPRAYRQGGKTSAFPY